MDIMNIFSIVVGILLIAIAVGATVASFHYLRCLNYDISFMSIVVLMCGVAAILAGIYL